MKIQLAVGEFHICYSFWKIKSWNSGGKDGNLVLICSKCKLSEFDNSPPAKVFSCYSFL